MVGMRLRSAVLLFGTLLVGAAVLGGAVSYGLFVDAHTGTGMIEAADSFNKVQFPKDHVAYDDDNRNGVWDRGEATYDVSTLDSFSDTTVQLRFHNSTTKNDISNQPLDIESQTISRDKKINIDHSGNSIRLHATDDITITDMKIKNGDQIRIVSVDGDVDISGVTFQNNNNVSVLAENGVVIMDTKTKCKSNGYVTIRDSDGKISCN